MYGELTDKDTITRLEKVLEEQQQDQFEMLLYKKNSKYFGKYCRLFFSHFFLLSLCSALLVEALVYTYNIQT